MTCPNRDFSERNCTKWGCEERAAGCSGELRGVTSSDNLVLLDVARRPVSASRLSSQSAVVRIHPGFQPGRPLAA